MSSKDELRTPPTLFKELDSVFNFFWDACCNKNNCLVKTQTLKVSNSPLLGWDNYDYLTTILPNINKGSGNVFVNPPFSNPFPFVEKAWDDSQFFRVVMLLKADMTTKWLNYTLERGCYVHHNQLNNKVSDCVEDLVSDMVNNNCNIGILHLRERIKFYVSEEVFEYDRVKNKYALWANVTVGDDGCHSSGLLETKNYKRVEDGIASKAKIGFPSMIVIFNRRIIK